MDLAVSNIAWDVAEDDAIAALLRREHVSAIEIAPTKWRERPLDASPDDVAAFRRSWEDRGIRIVALQALLFGRPDLQLFGDTRGEMLDYLRRTIAFAAAVGAETLVFGSPKNRVRSTLSPHDAEAVAVEFFRRLGDAAVEHDVVVCLEANPPEYGGDFITTTAEAVALCATIDNRGIAVNGDLGGMTLSGELPHETVELAGGVLGHFHASEPYLTELGESSDHAAAASALAAIDYRHRVSIEMKSGEPGSNVARVERAVRLARRTYAVSGA
jgi:D-psicose/D-tagatose/L-ribulose 3-epimerase